MGIIARYRQMSNVHTKIQTPVGELTLIASNQALRAIIWESGPVFDPAGLDKGPAQPDQPILQRASEQLLAYFRGERQTFDLPLAPQGTEFQKSVWQALLTIPYGQTRSYGELAAQIGQPKASRAVGAANGRNPLSIVVPCHRVIGSSGKLTGFGGGLEAKELLLKLESRQLSLF